MALGEPCMPGTPGPRQPGGDTDASDAHVSRSADTPYARATRLPIVNGTVGAATYGYQDGAHETTGDPHER